MYVEACGWPLYIWTEYRIVEQERLYEQDVNIKEPLLQQPICLYRVLCKTLQWLCEIWFIGNLYVVALAFLRSELKCVF